VRKFVRVVKILTFLFSIYLAVFVFTAGIISADNTLSSWKEKESVKIDPAKVEIEGLVRLTRETVILVTGLDEGISWFDVDERSLEKYIYSTGWVKNCMVKKTFPDSIRIVIEEFSPAIIVSNIKAEKKDDRENLYAMWFADSDGTVFKKAFPGEIDDSIPFFHIDGDVVTSESEREKIIKNGVTIARAWQNADEICSVQSLRYNSSGQYTADCEGENGLVTIIHLGNFISMEETANMSRRFLDTALKLRTKNIWAGEYIFEGTESNKRIVVGKVVKKINRGSDA